MKSNRVKNLKLRTLFFSRENPKKIYKMLQTNLYNNTFLTNNLNLFPILSIKKNLVSKTIKNRCVLSGCNNSVEKKYSISRMELRRLMRFGIIPGYNKSVW